MPDHFFRDFESYLRILVSLDEDDLQLVLKQYNSNFVKYELSPAIYTVKDISEIVYTMGDHAGTLQIEYDDFTMKKKPHLTQLVLEGLLARYGLTKNLFLKYFFGFYTILGL